MSRPPLGVAPPPIKRPLSLSHTHTSSRRSLSPFRISPWSRISEIHVPGGFSFEKSCCFRCFAGARARSLLGYPNVCVITDATLLCGAGLDGVGPARPDGLHHDLEIGKRSTTPPTSSYSKNVTSQNFPNFVI